MAVTSLRRTARVYRAEAESSQTATGVSCESRFGGASASYVATPGGFVLAGRSSEFVVSAVNGSPEIHRCRTADPEGRRQSRTVDRAHTSGRPKSVGALAAWNRRDRCRSAEPRGHRPSRRNAAPAHPREREGNQPYGVDWSRPVARFEEAMAQKPNCASRFRTRPNAGLLRPI
jgi:hypothetical protein